MLIGVPLETAAGETRVAVTPETAKKLKALGHTLRIQSGAGVAASATDEAYTAVGAEITDAPGAFGCELVLKVRAPSATELTQIKPGTALVGMLNPFDADGLQRLAAAGVTSFALEAAPRTTRAQSMDVLSSQANIAGYKAVMIAADRYQRFFPMLMTAAGTVKAARVVILGVGVAGLQAIATAKRLGAVIEASDVPGLICVSSAAEGERTFSTSSQPKAPGPSVISAPAAVYASSVALAATPAPDWMRSVCPRAFSFLAVSGVTATRVSPADVSSGTPISINASSEPSGAAPVLHPRCRYCPQITGLAAAVMPTHRAVGREATSVSGRPMARRYHVSL